MAKNLEQVSGLELWRPRDSFDVPLNVVVFDGLLSRLNMVTVKSRPDEQNLYVVAHDRPYEVVSPAEVYIRSDHLGAYPVAHCFDPLKEVEAGDGYIEEARARELQLAIARTAIKSAIASKNSDDFDKSVKDIIESFRDVKTEIHEKQQLHDSDILPGHNIFRALIEASERHKTVTKHTARLLAAMINGAVLPTFNYRTEKNESWHYSYGYRFEQRFATNKPAKSVSKRAAGSQAKKPTRAKRVIRSDKPLKPEKKVQQEITSEEIFLKQISSKSTPNDPEKRRDWLYKRYIEAGKKFPEHTETQKIETVKNGLRAYLDTYSEHVNPNTVLCLQTGDYLKGSRQERIFKRLLTTGNLFAAKVNYTNKHDPQLKPIKLPGIFSNTESILASFQITRNKLSGVYDDENYESAEAKQIANLLEAYIASTSFDYDFSQAPRF